MRKLRVLLWIAVVAICAAVGFVLWRSPDPLSPLWPHVKTVRLDYFSFAPSPKGPFASYRYRKSAVTDTSVTEVDRVMKEAYPAKDGWKWDVVGGRIEAWRGSEYVCYAVQPSGILVVEKLQLTPRELFKNRVKGWFAGRF